MKTIILAFVLLALCAPSLSQTLAAGAGEQAFHRLLAAHDSEILEILNKEDVTYACFPDSEVRSGKHVPGGDRFFLFAWSKPSSSSKANNDLRREREGAVGLYRYENGIRTEVGGIEGTWRWTPPEGGGPKPIASFQGLSCTGLSGTGLGADQSKYPECLFRLDANHLSFTESYENKAKNKVVHRINMRLPVGLFHESWDVEKSSEGIESEGRCERYNLGVKKETSAQAPDLPTFKAETESAFVWGQDKVNGAVSSEIVDPLTGNPIHRLNHQGIEVSSRVATDSLISWGEHFGFIVTEVTLVNNSDDAVTIKYGDSSLNGNPIPLIPLARSLKAMPKEEKKGLYEVDKFACFRSGKFPSDSLFGEHISPSNWIVEKTVQPHQGTALSFIVLPPRNTVCSETGAKLCHNVFDLSGAKLRQYFRVGAKDYVFVWDGPEMKTCGVP